MKDTSNAVKVSAQEEEATFGGPGWARVGITIELLLSPFQAYSLHAHQNYEGIEKMQRMHIQSPFLKLLSILEISTELLALLHGLRESVSIPHWRSFAGDVVRPEVSTDAPIDESAGPLRPGNLRIRSPSPEEYCIQCDNHRRLQSAISKLPSGYRRVFEIRLRSDSSMKEIAEEACITVAATKSQLPRARKALRSSVR